MQIIWYGQSCFKIINGGSTIVVDPFSKNVGLTPPRGKADVLLISDSILNKDDYSQIDSEFAVFGAGEYEFGGIHINGISAFNLNEKNEIVKTSTMYIIDIEGVRICHLSDFSEEQTLEVLDKIGQVDILMIPVGGDYKIDNIEIKSLGAEKAVEVVGNIDPRVVIPMNFKIPKLKVDLESVDKFLKLSGASDIKAIDKYVLKKKDLPNEERDIILMRLA